MHIYTSSARQLCWKKRLIDSLLFEIWLVSVMNVDKCRRKSEPAIRLPHYITEWILDADQPIDLEPVGGKNSASLSVKIYVLLLPRWWWRKWGVLKKLVKVWSETAAAAVADGRSVEIHSFSVGQFHLSQRCPSKTWKSLCFMGLLLYGSGGSRSALPFSVFLEGETCCCCWNFFQPLRPFPLF